VRVLERLESLYSSSAGLEPAEAKGEVWPLTPAGYRALVEQLPAILYVVEPHHLGRWHYVSPQVEELLGFSPAEWLADPHLWRKHLHPEDRERVLMEDARAVHSSQQFDSEYRMVTREGRVVWFRDRSAVTKKNRFASPLMQGVMLDITGQRLAREVLEQAEQQYRDIIENAVEGIFRTTADGRILRANSALARMFGYDSPEEMLASVSDIGSQLYVDPARRREFIRRIEAENTVKRFETEVRRRDGAKLWLSENTRAVRDSAGRTLYYEGTIEDVTERKRAEAERQVIYEIIEGVNVTDNLDELLRLIQQSLNKVLYAANCFVALHDPATGTFRFPFFADQRDPVPAPEKMRRSTTAYVFRTGQPLLSNQEVRERLIAQGEVELVGWAAAAWLGVPLKTPTATIGVLVVQHYEDPNAYTQRDLELLASVGGQVALAIERKRAEEALRANEARLRLLVEQLPAVIWTTDAELRFTSLQGAAVAGMGVKPEEMLGRPVGAFFCDAGDGPPVHAHRRALSGGTADFEIHCEGRTYESHVEPLRETWGKVIGSVGMALDVTARRELQEQFRQAQKMEAVGRLAGGIAHDFNNLLMVIRGYAELLEDGFRPAEAHRSAEQILKAADRAASLTHQLLAFSRKQVWNPVPLDLNGILEDIEPMLRRLIGEDIELAVRPGEGLGYVKADHSQIEQVILNLAVNARDAMPQGGCLTVETSAVELDDAYARHHAEVTPGPHVLLVVSDTGSGMNAETLAHIFEPFFTTKRDGTGLGLATVYGIVKQNGGHVWVYSEPGRGTTFKIYLPVAAGSAPAGVPAGPSAAATGLPRGSETILLVEDELAVRDLARKFLEETGYHVLEAAGGAEALELARSYCGEIHLLMTDVVMPGISGRELAQQLLDIRPGMKVLYMSGYTDDTVIERGILDRGVVLLQKPFTRRGLARKVRELLDPVPPLVARPRAGAIVPPDPNR
jgi:two-component system cell cycle sensor histidine kinase/response regulator CckA